MAHANSSWPNVSPVGNSQQNIHVNHLRSTNTSTSHSHDDNIYNICDSNTSMSDRTHYQHQQATNTSNNEESRQNQTYNKNNNTTTKYLQKNIPYPINSPVTTSQRTFGEPMQPLEEGVIRIASLNVNSLGKYSRSNPKQDLLKEWIHENDISVLGIQEVGVAMHMVSHYDKLEERMQDLRWTKMKVSYSSNRHESISVSQYGGTAICAFNEIAARANPRTGNDETGLGRWSWMLFEGRHQHKTRIISAYNPCRSKGNETVYMQHSRFLIIMVMQNALVKCLWRTLLDRSINGKHVVN